MNSLRCRIYFGNFTENKIAALMLGSSAPTRPLNVSPRVYFFLALFPSDKNYLFLDGFTDMEPGLLKNRWLHAISCRLNLLS